MLTLLSSKELEYMRVAGKIVAKAHRLVRELVRPGITTNDLDQAVRELIFEEKGEPAFFEYRGFPGNICASINEEVVHGIPGDRVLNDGDIISVDIGVRYKKYYGDAAVTLPVGEISEEAKNLIEATEKSLDAGLAEVKAGAKLSSVSRAIQEYAESRGYGVVQDFVGHGIGREMHQEPQVPNYVHPGGVRFDHVLRPGLCLAIEPMLNIGTWEVTRIGDWTVVTKDRKLSAHHEHTICVTETGCEILTTLEGGES